MLIEIASIPNIDKKLKKIIKKINRYNEEENWPKLAKFTDKLTSWMKKNLENLNIGLFIFSIIAEIHPEILQKSIISYTKNHLFGVPLKQRLNSIIVYGYYLRYQFDQNSEFDTSQLKIFFKLINDDEIEIRQNVSYFLENLPSYLDNQLFLEMDIFVEALRKEKNYEILQIIEKLLKRIQKVMSLPILQTYVKDLLEIYEKSDVPARSDVVLNLLELEIPILKKRKQKNWKKSDIRKRIINRIPLARLTDLNILAEKEDMELNKVKSYLISQLDESNFYAFTYTEKTHKKLLEFEKKNLINYFLNDKLKIEDIAKDFKNIGILHSSIFAVLIRDLIKKELINGFLSKTYYYNWKYLKKNLMQHLQNNGYIEIQKYSNFTDLDVKTVRKLLNEITEHSAYQGVFDEDKKKYYTYSTITEEIEENASKSNCIDLMIYREKYGQENFFKIEEYCRKNFFTEHHKKHIWLTNLGKIRIQQEMHKREQIGVCSLHESADYLELPIELLFSVTEKMFKHRNGFWNKDKTVFYYAKNIKKRLAKIQSEPNPTKRDSMIEDLANKLQIDKSEISHKVDEKLNEIAKNLSNKSEFKIKTVLKNLQMDYREFIKFIDSFEKTYIIIAGKVIFSNKRIEEEKNRLKSVILVESHRLPKIDIKELELKVKCAKKLLLSILNDLKDKNKIKGIWIKENEIFLTEYGIQSRMEDSKGFIDLYSFIPEITPKEKDIDFLENILKELIESNLLKGIYNEENKIYQSNDIAGEADLQVERERFEKGITPHIEDLEYSYSMLKEILSAKDITPGYIEEYEEILEKNIRKIFNTENFLKKLINNANSRLKKRYRNKNKSKNQRGKNKTEYKRKNFEDDEIVAGLLNDFENWKTLIFAIEQKAGQIVFLVKKIKQNKEDLESIKKKKDIFEYLGFLE